MDWLRRPGGAPRSTSASPPVALAPPPVETVVHSAPGLKEALARLPRPGASVLDLGAVSSANVEFFNRYQVKLRLLDLEGTLADAGLWEAPAKIPPWAARLPELLDLGLDDRFDLVLAWDFPNYFGRERWPFVARELANRVAPHGFLHLLVRTGKSMPARPSRYTLTPDTIVEEPRGESGSELVPPRYSHAEVERLHPGLAAAKSFLDKHGLQEIVLERSEELNLPPRPQAQPRQRRSG